MTTPFFLACIFTHVMTGAGQPPTTTEVFSAAAPSPTSWPAPPEPPDLIGWQLERGAWTTATDGLSTRESLFTPIACPPSSTFTVSGVFAACCSGACVISKSCTAVVTEADGNTTAPSPGDNGSNQLTCKYTEPPPASACQSTRLYPTPYERGSSFILPLPTHMVGCAPSSTPETATASFLFRFSAYEPTRPDQAYQGGSNVSLSTQQKIIVGVLVPVVVIVLVLAFVFVYRRRRRGGSARMLMQSRVTTGTTSTPTATRLGQPLPSSESGEVSPPKCPQSAVDVVQVKG